MDSPTGFYFVTLTAPGADVLPWDSSRCTHGAAVSCSGERGCVVDELAAAEWNGSAPQRWSWFVEYLRREFAGNDLQFFKCWETQRRGLLHAHALMRTAQPVTRRRMRQAIQTCAIGWGFGRQVDVQHVQGDDVETIVRQAGYCAKYASKSSDQPAELLQLDRSTGEVRHPGYRPWSASKRWGETMRSLRLSRRAFMAAGGHVDAVGGGAGGGAALDLREDFYTPPGVGVVAQPSAVGAASV